MRSKIAAITLKNRFASVNCYLLESDGRFILIDTGWAATRSTLEKEFEKAGCTSQNLRLILVTHGDFDHCGNCAHLHNQYGAKVAMHQEDTGMVAEGDLFWSRRRPNLIMRTLAQTLFKLNLQDRFMPDICLHNDDTLTAYGFHGRIVHVPGHTRGSIGILMEDGAFFCGDLFENRKKPTLNSLMDDPSAARASLEKLRKLNIGFVYPGHGVPFPFAALSGESI